MLILGLTREVARAGEEEARQQHTHTLGGGRGLATKRPQLDHRRRHLYEKTDTHRRLQVVLSHHFELSSVGGIPWGRARVRPPYGGARPVKPKPAGRRPTTRRRVAVFVLVRSRNT